LLQLRCATFSFSSAIQNLCNYDWFRSLLNGCLIRFFLGYYFHVILENSNRRFLLIIVLLRLPYALFRSYSTSFSYLFFFDLLLIIWEHNVNRIPFILSLMCYLFNSIATLTVSWGLLR
jgi:hypothetical protein